MKLIMTKGLPASGKSTWAKAMAVKSGGQTKRVNKDDLRVMLDGGKWSKNNEKNILKVRDLLVEHHLTNGSSVIVDDTNLHPKHAEVLRQIARKYEATFETKSFLDVSLKTCIELDLKRENSVGEKVIQGMFDSFLAPAPVVYEPKPDLRHAIIVDIDGTIAHMVDRGPYDLDKVGSDSFDSIVATIAKNYMTTKIPSVKVILLSGREDSARDATVEWLKKHKFIYHHLYMRKAGDMRKDTVVKKELFENHVRDNYQIDFVLDDRNQVVDMWRNELGLKCLQVAEGDF